jgi:starch synthase (maltosyl-transferring)
VSGEEIQMSPAPGARTLRFVGDKAKFQINGGPAGAKGFLRTNIGRAAALRAEIIEAHNQQVAAHGLPVSYRAAMPVLNGASWRDIPMRKVEGGWEIELTLSEVGYFQAKAFFIDEKGRQHWPWGPNIGVTVHPDAYRSGNTIYCAFPRMFGPTKALKTTIDEQRESELKRLDQVGYTVIPPSGKLRDLARELPHITQTLGCRILHLLPVSPTPTTYARFGRFGSPYAVQDLTGIDPAMVEFDKRTTGIQQFEELVYNTHLHGARVFLDLVINHTGWGSWEQERHPQWFLKEGDHFISPGAWGTIWEDLVEMDHRLPISWEYLADVFLIWCRRGVDGFRCDAGYKVPPLAWKYITARVRDEFPDALFLLEGLGGSWEATDTLLTEGGMQWAYSELFQNYSGAQVGHYLDHSNKKSESFGLLVHYSETHDNDRLAKKGRTWSLLRNQLCALTSYSGGFGFTCGVEWLAPERVNVHSSRGLSWGSKDNLVLELAELTRLLREHPCFYDGAKLTRVSEIEAVVYVLHRESAEGLDHVLVIANLDDRNAHKTKIDQKVFEAMGRPLLNLLSGGAKVHIEETKTDIGFKVDAGECLCLATSLKPKGLSGAEYVKRRAQSAFAIQAIAEVLRPEAIGSYNWKRLAELVDHNPEKFLANVGTLEAVSNPADLVETLLQAPNVLPRVVSWTPGDDYRITLVPPGHWLLVSDKVPFRAKLTRAGTLPEHRESIEANGRHICAFPPRPIPITEGGGPDALLDLQRFEQSDSHIRATLRFLTEKPVYLQQRAFSPTAIDHALHSPIALLTNGVGGMARMCVDLGRVKSKYDCALGANLHAEVPVDRHVFVKRVRAWVNAAGFITALDSTNLMRFEAGPPAVWRFRASAGDGSAVEVELTADMLEGRNTTVLDFRLVSFQDVKGTPRDGDVRLTVRLDIEDRNFHSETERNGGAEFHLQSHSKPLPDRVGFVFTPASDRQLRVYTSSGSYFHEGEWSRCAHYVEATRGQKGLGDAYSPGWFDLPLARNAEVTLVLTADAKEPLPDVVTDFAQARRVKNIEAVLPVELPEDDRFGRQLALASQAFVVRRHDHKTIIAGYPWFLDWGRDSLIAARGLLAAGMEEEVRQLLITFGRFERDGTMPNTIHGEDASNRDTSDAALWYGVVVEELAERVGPGIYDVHVEPGGRRIADVLRDLAMGCQRGTPNGIRMDEESGLLFSPRHFTWMDTNYPAGTPREGYPVEIQALWIRLLRQIGRMRERFKEQDWPALAERAAASFERLFWIEEKGWFADCLLGAPMTSAEDAVVDDALRSNCLFAVTLGLASGDKARRCVEAARRHLVVPGALRSLAPLPVSTPLAIHAADGRLLNNPHEPYRGRYEGDEDASRKPAYHNGTAWTWTFPSFCEAVAIAWDFSPEAVSAARAYLGSMDRLLMEGCIGHLPEITDGDYPHLQRGCDAQAWSATEALRVWKLLHRAR